MRDCIPVFISDNFIFWSTGVKVVHRNFDFHQQGIIYLEKRIPETFLRADSLQEILAMTRLSQTLLKILMLE